MRSFSANFLTEKLFEIIEIELGCGGLSDEFYCDRLFKESVVALQAWMSGRRLGCELSKSTRKISADDGLGRCGGGCFETQAAVPK